ncbi:MAG: hypothetical protein PHX45_11360 [Acidobacteriota bacterium]|nr:hypothetical protein [Acidobacteriota bacterium]
MIGAAVFVCAFSASACRNSYKGASELHARRVLLEREVEGLREVVTRLERQEPMLPPGDVSIAITDSLVRDMIAAQLPLDADVDRFHVSLQDVEVVFRGNSVVRLLGTLHLLKLPALKAQVDVIGALEDLDVDPAAATLSARVAIDHLGIDKVASLGSLLSGATLDEMARSIRLKIEERLPQVQIPVRVQQTIDLPAITKGPVRIDGASLPLKVTVSQVTAVRGRLWVALHFEPGGMTKTAPTPDITDTKAAETGSSLDSNGGGSAGTSAAKSPGWGN